MSQFAFSSGRSRPRASLLAACLAALVLAAACEDNGTGSGRAVARVAVTASASTLEAGKTLLLTAVAYDRRDRALTGTTFSWASSSDALAAVAADGTVTGRAAGPVTITATTEGVPGTLALTITAPPVVPPPPQQVARVAVAPAFATVDAGGTSTLRAATLAANGDTVRGPTLTWSATPEAAATVSAAGVVTGVAAGQARVVVRSGNFADTATVAVLGARTLLSTAFPGGSIRASVPAGQTFTVPVVLDLGKLGSNGDLGSAQFDLV
ncbi:MAG TPA: Ig-like domain-containing protein, partial [Longimicrobiaceae bacterium]|nr:Ig-like domain-containing protein [Longimicrobiaceae bacterium]